MTKKPRKSSQPTVGILTLGLLISLLIHIVPIASNFPSLLPDSETKPEPKDERIRLQIRPKQQIAELRQEPTEAPDDPSYLSYENHKTEKETKLSQEEYLKRLQPGLDPAAQLGGPTNQQSDQGDNRKTPTESPKQSVQIAKPLEQLAEQGQVPRSPQEQSEARQRRVYESLMPNRGDLNRQISGGYQTYIDSQAALGNRIDINTADYRFIGYFSALRKAFEMVWVYPKEAVRRGLQGEVQIEFTILGDGSVRRVKVLNSSGFDILDRAVMDAIKLAAPYSPLPDGVERPKVVTGSFRYILSSYF